MMAVRDVVEVCKFEFSETGIILVSDAIVDDEDWDEAALRSEDFAAFRPKSWTLDVTRGQGVHCLGREGLS